MITISYIQLLIGLFIFLAVKLSYRYFIFLFFAIKAHFVYKKKKAMLDEMKNNNEYHEWFQYGSYAICKKTGYCPTLDAFIDLEVIKEHLERNKKMEEIREEFELHKNKRLDEMSLKFNIPRETMSDIYSELSK